MKPINNFLIVITFTSLFLFSIFIELIDDIVATTENVSSLTNDTSLSSKPNNLAIKVGEGNNTVSFTQYFPPYAEVKVGDSITWYNGMSVPNPHTVTFIQDLGHLEKIGVPFYISNDTRFVPVIDNLGEPLLEKTNNGTNIVMVLNSNALTPTIITSDDETLRLKKDSVIDFQGNEKFVNSGPILALDKEQNFDYSFTSSFTLVFKNPGLYEYSCLFHPWMIGKILVKP